MKYFTIPGYFFQYKLIKILLRYRELHPEFFRKDRVIDSSFDFPMGLIWNGGRSLPFHQFEENYFLEVVNYYKNSNLKLKHTCTNFFITETMLYDHQSNWWVREFEKPGNAVIVSNELLKNYIEKTYPKYDIICSTTMAIHDPNKINELTDQGYMVVLEYNDQHNKEFLSKIKHPEKCEIMCAEACEPKCPMRKQHEKVSSRVQLWDFEIRDVCFSDNHYAFNLYETNKLSTGIPNEYIDELYDMGFCNFKVSGRTLKTHQWIELMVYYLVNPEHRDGVRQDLFNIFYENYEMEEILYHYKG